MNQVAFQFDSVYQAATTPLPPLPSLSGITRLGLDTETTVEDWMPDRELVGISYYKPDRTKGYIPIKHPESQNYPEWAVKEWAKHELKDKQLVVANGKHEHHTFKNWGIDLELQGNSFRDVFHRAALINEKRPKLNMDVICAEELPHIPKLVADHKHLYKLPADHAGPVAAQDSELAWMLDEAYEQRIQDEGLETVCQLEDDLIFATCEMEKNGSYLNVPLILKWDREVEEEHTRRLMQLYNMVQMQVNPSAPTDMSRLFAKLGINNEFETDTGDESFTVDVLKEYAHRHPAINLCIEAKQLASLRSKTFQKFLASVKSDGRIYAAFHQLRGDDGGTVTGRYSSSAFSRKKGAGINIQQVTKTKKMPQLLKRWPVRKAFVAPPDRLFFSSDGSQIEYRGFAHIAAKKGMRRVAERFINDPKVDFHALVQEWTGLERDYAKNVNFCKLFGGGPEKIALMCGVSVEKGRAIVNKYDREFPEAKVLMDMAQRQAQTIGWVRTLLGRRRRYDVNNPNERFYSALNAVIQGGMTGDLIKLKILHLYKERKKFGLTMRATVHDEINGDIPDGGVFEPLSEFMNIQEYPLEVPIIWESRVGANWEEAH